MPAHTNCAGVTRRDSLQLGLGALLGGGLASALRAKASGPGSAARQAKACILIWMDGGPTHYEMFDPKPNAPAEFRGEFGTVATAVPGVRYSEHMKQLAGMLGKYAMIRSVRHDQGNHGAGNHYLMTGAPPVDARSAEARPPPSRAPSPSWRQSRRVTPAQFVRAGIRMTPQQVVISR